MAGEGKYRTSSRLAGGAAPDDYLPSASIFLAAAAAGSLRALRLADGKGGLPIRPRFAAGVLSDDPLSGEIPDEVLLRLQVEHADQANDNEVDCHE